MMKFAIGIALSFTVGVCCRLFDIPVPSPPFLPGALLVLVMTLGYSGANAVLKGRNRPTTTSHLCGAGAAILITTHAQSGLCERLREEEACGTDYRDLKDARTRIGDFLEKVYNQRRLHSALRYLTPDEFEQANQVTGSDGIDGTGGKPKAGLPPLPQALEIPSGFPHSRGPTTAYQ